MTADGEGCEGFEDSGDLEFLGGTDLVGLFSEVQRMQERLEQEKVTADSTVIMAGAGDGAVRVEVTGGLEFRKVIIDASLVGGSDPSLLEDLILAALRDAMRQLADLSRSAVDRLGLDIASPSALPGLGALSGLGDLSDLGRFDFGSLLGLGDAGNESGARDEREDDDGSEVSTSESDEPR